MYILNEGSESWDLCQWVLPYVLYTEESGVFLQYWIVAAPHTFLLLLH